MRKKRIMGLAAAALLLHLEAGRFLLDALKNLRKK